MRVFSGGEVGRLPPRESCTSSREVRWRIKIALYLSCPGKSYMRSRDLRRGEDVLVQEEVTARTCLPRPARHARAESGCCPSCTVVLYSAARPESGPVFARASGERVSTVDAVSTCRLSTRSAPFLARLHSRTRWRTCDWSRRLLLSQQCSCGDPAHRDSAWSYFASASTFRALSQSSVLG